MRSSGKPQGRATEKGLSKEDQRKEPSTDGYWERASRIGNPGEHTEKSHPENAIERKPPGESHRARAIGKESSKYCNLERIIVIRPPKKDHRNSAPGRGLTREGHQKSYQRRAPGKRLPGEGRADFQFVTSAVTRSSRVMCPESD